MDRDQFKKEVKALNSNPAFLKAEKVFSEAIEGRKAAVSKLQVGTIHRTPTPCIIIYQGDNFVFVPVAVAMDFINLLTTVYLDPMSLIPTPTPASNPQSAGLKPN